MTSESSKLDPLRKRRTIGTRHFLETYATSIMLHGCTLAQSVILARVLGAEGRGVYAAIILWPTILANIGNLGIGLATTRAAAASLDDVGPVARTGVLLSLLLSIVTTGIGLVILPLLIPEADSDITGLAQIYLILFVPAFILSANIAGVDQGRGHFRRLNFFRLLQSPVFVSLLVVLLVLARTDMVYCLWALVASFWVTTLGRFVLLVRELPLFGPISSPIKLLRQGIPYAVVNIIGQFIHRGDRILLLWLLTERDLGLYVVAFSAASVLAHLPKSMGFVTLTIAAQEKPREGFARIAQIFRGAVIISVAVGIVLAVAVYLLLPVVYGQDFADARLIGVILAGGIIVHGLASVLGQSMRGQGKPMVGIFPNLAALTVMVLVAFALSRPLGVIGVAMGFAVAQTVRTCGWLLLTVRYYNSAFLSDMLPTVQDAKLINRRLKQQAVEGLTKIRIIRPSTTQNVSNSDNNVE